MAKTRSIAIGAGGLFSRLTGGLLLLLVLLTMVVPRFSAIPYARVPAIATFAGLAAVTALVIRAKPAVPERLARLLALPVGIVCTTVAAFVGYASYYVTTWDSKMIQNVVSRPLEAVTASQAAYLSRYPNNDVLLALARQVRRLGDGLGWGYGTAFLALQVVCLGIALAGVYHVTAVMGDRTAALLAMVVVTVLVGLSPWMAVPYTDLPSMIAPIWAVYCCIRARRAVSSLTTAAWVLTAGGILALGYALKVTPVAVVVAAVLWFLAAATVERTRRAWTACAVQLAGLTLGLVAGLVITDAAVARLADAPKTTPGVAASAWHYVASGLRVQIGPNGNRVFGGYDRPVNVATSGKPTEVQTQISKDFIRRDLERRGLVGTVLFQVNKLDFTWGDGMLWAYGEGTDLSRKPVHQGQPFELVQSWNSPGGEHFGARVAITQGFWWLLLTLVAFGWLRGRVTAESLLLVLALVGVAGFTLLFQGRSRYLITYVPLLAVAAVWWWRDLGAVRPRRGGAAIDAPTPEQEREPQVV